MSTHLLPYQKTILERLGQTNVRFVEFPKHIGRTFRARLALDAMQRRAHLLSLASSSVAPTKVWIDEAVVVDFPRAVAAAPSLTGSTTTTPSAEGDNNG